MKRTLLALAAIAALVTVTVWAALGAHTGWTKTRVEVLSVDEVTELQKREWQDKFLPGVDFLGAGLLTAIALAGASLFFRHRTPTKPNN